MKNNVVLITGDNGFVGLNLAKKLEKFYKLINLNQIVGKQDARKRYNVTDGSFITKHQHQFQIDTIIHMAGKTSIPDSIEKPYETYLTNIIGTLNILEFARLNKIKKIIYLSTYVFGDPEYLPIDEKHNLKPHSPYNKSKLIGENLCKIFSTDYKIDVVVLRPFYLYGKYNKATSLIPRIINNIEKSQKVILSKKFTKRDFLYIDDFVDLIIKVLANFPQGYNEYNVGYGTNTKIEDVVKKISKLLNKKTDITYQKNIRPVDILDMSADITKVSLQFGWRPKINIDEGLNLILKNNS